MTFPKKLESEAAQLRNSSEIDKRYCYCLTVKTHGTNFALIRLMFKSVVKMF